jgi:pimeloyl-ACP methyl ester carboxylesterase
MRRIRRVPALLVLLPTLLSPDTQTTPAVVPRDNFFDSNGVRLRYIEQGQGAPVVLIHGYTGTLDRHWIAPGVFGELAKEHRVIALDCRGHGKSDKPHDSRAYGAEMGQDVVRLLDHLKIGRAHVVGYSMGAIIAGHLLTTNPDRFITATLVAHHAVHKWTPADEQEAEASARDLESDTPFKSLVVALTPRGAPLPSDDEIRKSMQPLVTANDLKALSAYNRGRRGLVVSEQVLAAVRVPTLAIIGSADPSVEGVRELAKIMPALETVVVEGAEHGGPRGILRRPEFLPTLREFFGRAAQQKDHRQRHYNFGYRISVVGMKPRRS